MTREGNEYFGKRKVKVKVKVQVKVGGGNIFVSEQTVEKSNSGIINVIELADGPGNVQEIGDRISGINGRINIK